MVVQLSLQSAAMFFALDTHAASAPPLALDPIVAIVQETEEAADQDQRPNQDVSSVPS
jgi:hypothetical protein